MLPRARACECACVRACVRACACVCVSACVPACVRLGESYTPWWFIVLGAITSRTIIRAFGNRPFLFSRER